MTTHPEDGPSVYRPIGGAPAADDAAPPPPPPAAAEPATRPARWKRVGVLLAAVALVPVVGVVVRVLRTTAEAGAGATDPTAAAVAWMYDVRAGEGDGPGPHVDQAATGDVRRVRTETIAAMRSHGATLVLGSAPEGQDQPAAAGTVTDWWAVDYGGMTYSEPLPWRFTLNRDGDRWRITAVQAPPMCGPGGYFRTCS